MLKVEVKKQHSSFVREWAQNLPVLLDMKRMFLMLRVVGHWTGSPREAVLAPPLELFSLDFDQPDPEVKDVPAHGKGVGLDGL